MSKFKVGDKVKSENSSWGTNIYTVTEMYCNTEHGIKLDGKDTIYSEDNFVLADIELKPIEDTDDIRKGDIVQYNINNHIASCGDVMTGGGPLTVGERYEVWEVAPSHLRVLNGGPSSYFHKKRFSLVKSNDMTRQNCSKEKVEVSVDFIKAAYKTADAEWKKTLEMEFPHVLGNIYRLGDRYRGDSGIDYIVCGDMSSIGIISLKSGITYGEFVKLKSPPYILEEDMVRATDCKEWKRYFTKI